MTKDYIVELKILPYFSKKKMLDIKAADIRKWQNQLMSKGYSQTYLRNRWTDTVWRFLFAGKVI